MRLKLLNPPIKKRVTHQLTFSFFRIGRHFVYVYTNVREGQYWKLTLFLSNLIKSTLSILIPIFFKLNQLCLS